MERRTGGEMWDSEGICLCVLHTVNDRKDLCMICMIRLCTGSHNTVLDQILVWIASHVTHLHKL